MKQLLLLTFLFTLACTPEPPPQPIMTDARWPVQTLDYRTTEYRIVLFSKNLEPNDNHRVNTIVYEALPVQTPTPTPTPTPLTPEAP